MLTPTRTLVRTLLVALPLLADPKVVEAKGFLFILGRSTLNDLFNLSRSWDMILLLLAHPADVDAGVGRGGLLEVEVVLLDDGHVVDKVGARPPLRPPPLIT